MSVKIMNRARWRAGAQRASARADTLSPAARGARVDVAHAGARAPTRWLRPLLAGIALCSGLAASVAPVRAEGANKAAPAAKSAAPAAPSKILGSWEVKRVLLDLADKERWGSLRPGTPALLYRTMTITADKISFAGADATCDQSSWQPLATTWQALFQTTDLSRLSSDRTPIPATPADYDLKLSGKQRVQAYPLCSRGPLSSPEAWRGAYWLALQGDELLVRYGKQLILVLRKRRPSDKPQASFLCEKAATPTEKAICADFEAAGRDRSLAEALQQALARRKESAEQERIMRDQLKWKTKRDTCGESLDCIRKACDERVTQLLQE